MNSYLFINNIWPEFAELLATRPITIHGFHSTGMDYLNKTFFGFILNLYYYVLTLIDFIFIFSSGLGICMLNVIILWFKKLMGDVYYGTTFYELSHPVLILKLRT